MSTLTIDKTSASTAANAHVEALQRDGFVILRGLFPRQTALQAKAELEEWFQKDLADRQQKSADNSTGAKYGGDSIELPGGIWKAWAI